MQPAFERAGIGMEVGHLEQRGEVVAVAGAVEGALAGVEGLHRLAETDDVADEAQEPGDDRQPRLR